MVRSSSQGIYNSIAGVARIRSDRLRETENSIHEYKVLPEQSDGLL